MLLGVIADDFTGASDIANTIAKGLCGEGGLRTAQFLGIPEQPAPGEIEAGVIALKSRSIPAAEAVEQSLAALAWLRAQGCGQIIFKYCSTFDSTQQGNIGPVGEALANALGVKGVVACPAFPGAGRTLYQGHLFVKDRLLNQSGLEHHPLNPMTDPDLRRWLRFQTNSPVGHVAWARVAKGTAAIDADLKQASEAGETMVIVDAVSDDDLIVIGEALRDAPLITGGSGIAIGLPRNFIRRGLAKGSKAVTPPIAGPEAILAGSCSGATRGQVDQHKARHPALALDVDSVMTGETTSREAVEFITTNHGKSPLVYSSGTPEEVARLQERYGRDKVAHTLDRLFADTARELVARGVRRLVVAGGETSGAVVSALDLGPLAIGPEIDPGVPVLVSGGSQPVALALKSGNFGAPDFFEKALGRLEGK
ncbi:3-oxo-tetronate kinase [Allorhizobium undicola]|uniref:3-oxo-tetronate kinase n=1 Tax=Allorhizobium undicola TaxID=78527 RepID=UPI003D341374